MKKDEQGNPTNGVVIVNGIDDDKGFKWVFVERIFGSLRGRIEKTNSRTVKISKYSQKT